jgi:AhpC/TSA family
MASLLLPAPPVTAIAVMDDLGVVHRPMELGQARAAVFIFLGVECPISNSYAPEINRIVADYSAKGINFYMVYPESELTADQVKQHATAFGYHCPALMDGEHLLVSLFHVAVTSESIIVGKDGKVLYHGRIDDLYVDFGKKRFAATTHELRDALDAVVGDRPVPTAMTKTVGCPI